MVTKLRIYVCPEPDCAVIGSKGRVVCSKHPNRIMIQETYEHRPKLNFPTDNHQNDLKDEIHNIFNNLFGVKGSF